MRFQAIVTGITIFCGIAAAAPANNIVERQTEEQICLLCHATGVPCVQEADGSWGCGSPPPGSLP